MKVDLSPRAQKDILKLPRSQQKKISKKIRLLKEDILSGKKLGGELEEQRSLRAWPYRILYFIKSDHTAWVVTIQHRQSAYKK